MAFKTNNNTGKVLNMSKNDFVNKPGMRTLVYIKSNTQIAISFTPTSRKAIQNMIHTGLISTKKIKKT
jgi:hypothetical protein